MPFMNGIWVDPEIPQQDLPDKIQLTERDISLSSIQANESMGDFVCVFSVITTNPNYNFNDRATLLRLDKNSLKNAIEKSIPVYDQKYMVLIKWDMNKAKFKFNYNKWLKDALGNAKPHTSLSKYEKKLMLKTKLPRVIAFANSTEYVGEFIIKKFLEFTSDRKFNFWFDKLIPKQISSKIRTKIRNMFDYNYDIQKNNIIIRLKPEFILGILYALGQEQNLRKNLNRNPYVKIDFTKKVKDNVKRFKKSRWNKFLNKKLL